MCERGSFFAVLGAFLLDFAKSESGRGQTLAFFVTATKGGGLGNAISKMT